MEKINKLEILAKPIVEFIRENYDPYVNIIITDSNVRVIRDIAGIPNSTSNEE